MNSKQRRSQKFHLAKGKYPIAKVRPQDEFPAFMARRRVVNLKEKTASLHPYDENIWTWRPKPKLMEVREVEAKGKAMVVQNEVQFQQMMDDIKQQYEITVDLEGHTERCYNEMNVLIQVSTYYKDYIIHVPSCVNLIMRDLKPVFESFEIVKILHGAQNDIFSMQRDYDIFMCAVIDTQLVYNYCYGEPKKGHLIGFKDMAKDLLGASCPKDWDEGAGLADWRVFPLPEKLQLYAQYDSALLMKCWQILKKGLADGSWEDSPLNPIDKSNANTCKIVKLRRPSTAEEDKLGYNILPEETNHYNKLHSWRLQRAKIVDEKPKEVITGPELAKIVKMKPKTEIELRSVFRSKTIPRWLVDVTHEIINLIHPPVVEEIDDRRQETTIECHDSNSEEMECEQELPVEIYSRKVEEVEFEKEEDVFEIFAPLDSLIPSSPPQGVTKSHIRTVKAPQTVPLRRKKWISNPPQKPPQPKQKHLKLKRDTPRYVPRPEGVPRKRSKLTPEQKAYQTKRRSFNRRQRKQIKKLQVTVEFSDGSPPKSTFVGGMCDAQYPKVSTPHTTSGSRSERRDKRDHKQVNKITIEDRH
ncbi:unnamed protein product [Orchesella dallaii]|uniref:HRDC domain-containing protein n=1 Tax=Orchesella dallaii TaxID=48710 RepID=A0ABP1RUA3_9HEXA